MIKRYSLRIPRKGLNKFLVIETHDDADQAIRRAKQLPTTSVHDRSTGRIYVASIGRWVSESGAAVIHGHYSPSKRDQRAEQRMLADLAAWTNEGQAESFSAEGC